MFRRPHFVAFGIVLLTVLGVLNLPERHAARAKLVWGSVFMPMFGLAATAQDLVRSTASRLLPRHILLQQVESLRLENQQLRIRLTQLEEVAREQHRLRAALGWQPNPAWRLRAARVMGHDPAQWWRSLLIDLGTRDGLQVNQTVLTAEGLVGRVSEVSYAQSRVLLVGDPNCRFSGQIVETRDKGIIAPADDSFDRQVVQLTYIPTGVTLRSGQRVATSGEGGVFPKGIPVGEIVEARTNRLGLFLEARVRLRVNLNRLEEVWVIFP